MKELNVYTWFSDRKLTYCPAHFIVVKTFVTNESKLWIMENLRGRFCLVDALSNDPFTDPSFGNYPAFEDPQEATYFQLIWS